MNLCFSDFTTSSFLNLSIVTSVSCNIMEGRSHSNQPFYTKVRQFAQGDENRNEHTNGYRTAINSIIEQLKSKTNIKELKELVRVIDRWDQHHQQKGKGGSELDRLYHLRLQDVEKLLGHLDGCFIGVMEQMGDRRVEGLYSQFRHILHRISKLEPTSMHANSTQMKKHLLDQFKDEQEKRLKVEKQKNLLIEGTQEALQQKDRIIRELRAGNNISEQAFLQKDRQIRQLRAENARLNQQLKDLQDGLRDLRNEQSMNLRDLKAENSALREMKNQNESLYARVNFMNKDIAEKEQSVNDCIRTIQALKRSLSDARSQLAQKPQIDYVVECMSCKKNNSQQLSNSPSYLSQTSRPGPKVFPPAPPKPSTKAAGGDDNGQEQKYSELLRLLFVQAISLQGFLGQTK